MRIFIPIVVFFFVSANINGSSLDTNDKNKITKHFNTYVENGSLPNISILIKKDNKEIYRHSHGFADIKRGIAVNDKTIYRIYSMTKPITGVAIMQLVENGQLRLNDKVSKYIPAFKNTKVINLDFQDYVVKPKREITIRDLLTHTSGLTYSWAGEGPVNQIYRKYNIRPYYFGALDAELNKFPGNTCQFAAAAASAPLLHNPGEKWSYGINMDILGCVVEVVSKMTFGEYLQKNIFDPLNLKSIGFSVKPFDGDYFTTLYTSGAFSRDGEVVAPSGLNQAELMFSKELRSIDSFDKSPYLTNSSKLFDGGPTFIDIKSPLNPSIVGGYSFSSYSHDAQVVKYHGPDTRFKEKEILFGSNSIGGENNQLIILDVTDKKNPELISSIEYSNAGYTHQGWISDDHKYFFYNLVYLINIIMTYYHILNDSY